MFNETFRKGTVESSAAGPSLSSKRLKREPLPTEVIADEDVEQLLSSADRANQCNAKPENDSGLYAGDVEASVKSEDDNIVGKLLLAHIKGSYTVCILSFCSGVHEIAKSGCH